MPKVPARQSKSIDLPDYHDAHDIGETWLTLTFQLRHATSWAEAGHIINICQTKLNSVAPKAVPSTISNRIDVQETTTSIRIEGASFSVLFDKVHGSIHQWTIRGHEVFSMDKPGQQSLSLGFWRAPTDNDVAYQSAEWKNWGLDDMRSSLLDCKLDQKLDSVVITCKTHLMPPILAWGFAASVEYTFTSDGKIAIKSSLKPFGPAPKTLPRVGLDLQLSSAIEDVKWFGRGPGESYNDSHLSQWVGIHQSSLDSLQTRYDVPQECGNHFDTRWLEVCDASGNGFKVEYRPGPEEREHFQWALMKYNAQDLEYADHPCDLVARNGPFLRLDCDHAGLGTAACGPGPEDDCKVQCREREFSFTLSPC